MPARTAAAAWMVALVGCEDGRYELVVHVPGETSSVAVVEVAVLESCSEIAVPGQDPDAPIRTVEVSATGAEPIGWLAEGRYGLYGRAWDDGCFLYAAGCTPARVEDGGSGTLDVYLEALSSPGGCDDSRACSSGRCVALDGGSDQGGDSGADAEADSGADAGCEPPPRIVGSIDTPGVANDVAMDGTSAFVADGDEGLRIIDVADPTLPEVVGAVDTADDAQAVAIAQPHAYVADIDDGLVVIDVRDTAAPVIVGSLDTTGFARDVAVQGGYAFVADANWDLDVIDVSDPMAPTLVARADVEGSISSVAVSGSYVLVGSGFRLQSVWVASPAEASLVGYSLGAAYDIALWAGRAYTAAGEYGLNVFDVSDPDAGIGRIELEIDTPGSAAGVAAAEGIVLVADGSEGLQILDAADPDAPVVVGVVDTPGVATAVAIDGALAFVADGARGLQVVDLGCWAR